MKSFHRYITLLFAATFFLLSTSFTYYRSFCEEGCDTKISVVSELDECCADEVQEDSCHEDTSHEDEDECCGVDFISFELDLDMENWNVNTFTFHAIDEFVDHNYFDFASSLSENNDNTGLCYRGPPKEEHGCLVILKKNSFLI